MNKEIKIRNICFIIIIIICVLALSYGVYYDIFIKNSPVKAPKVPISTVDVEFEELFDNSLHLQDYNSAGFTLKEEPTKEIVYTEYTLNEIFEGKYDIHVNIPIININHENITKINKEITSIFYDKVNSLIEASKEEGASRSIYTVSYTAYLNENILSLVIKATLKEGTNAQRVIIQGYNYNLSTNQLLKLEDVLEVKKIAVETVEEEINKTIQGAIDYSQNMSSLGHETYKRNIKNTIYQVENSNNFILGPNGAIYIIYAYGNTNFTTENDIVYIK